MVFPNTVSSAVFKRELKVREKCKELNAWPLTKDSHYLSILVCFFDTPTGGESDCLSK